MLLPARSITERTFYCGTRTRTRIDRINANMHAFATANRELAAIGSPIFASSTREIWLVEPSHGGFQSLIAKF
jgi:hypothetical protein